MALFQTTALAPDSAQTVLTFGACFRYTWSGLQTALSRIQSQSHGFEKGHSHKDKMIVALDKNTITSVRSTFHCKEFCFSIISTSKICCLQSELPSFLILLKFLLNIEKIENIIQILRITYIARQQFK